MLALSVVSLVLVQSVRVADEPVAPQNISKQYEFLIRGMDDTRQRLRTGQYRVTGRFTDDHPTWGRLEGPVTIFSAFDYDAKKFRFDRVETFREGLVTPPGTSPQKSWKASTKGGRMIESSDRMISVLDGLMLVKIGELSPATARAVKPLDARAFGLFYWNELTSYPATTYPGFLEILEREKPEEIVQEGRGIWRITWTMPEVDHTYSSRRIVWLDAKVGYSPIRMELKVRMSSMPPGFWPNPSETTETTWTEIGGTWVPKTCLVVNHPSLPSSQSYALTFDWEIVNGAIAEKLFTIEGLEAPPDYPIIDTTLGQSIDVGSVGADHKPIDRTLVADPPPSRPRRPWRDLGPVLPYLATAFGVGVLALAAWMKWRSTGRHRAG